MEALPVLPGSIQPHSRWCSRRAVSLSSARTSSMLMRTCWPPPMTACAIKGFRATYRRPSASSLAYSDSSKPLPLAAILGDDGYLPKALDAVLYVLERPTTIDLCPDFLCQRPIATFDHHGISGDGLPLGFGNSRSCRPPSVLGSGPSTRPLGPAMATSPCRMRRSSAPSGSGPLNSIRLPSP